MPIWGIGDSLSYKIHKSVMKIKKRLESIEICIIYGDILTLKDTQIYVTMIHISIVNISIYFTNVERTDWTPWVEMGEL